MPRRDWWLGVLVLAAALVFYAVFPRYDFHGPSTDGLLMWRVDRWTGSGEWSLMGNNSAPWAERGRELANEAESLLEERRRLADPTR